MVSWEYNVQGVDRPIDILGVYRPGSISSNALGVYRPNKWEYIGQGVDRLVITGGTTFKIKKPTLLLTILVTEMQHCSA